MVSDGLSKTALMSERLMGRNVSGDNILRLDKRLVYWKLSSPVPRTPYGPQSVIDMAKACDEAPTSSTANLHFSGASAENTFSGIYWSQWDYHERKWYNHVGRPNALFCSDAVDTSLSWGQMPPTSNHGGGVHLMLGDGSIQFVGDSVDQMVWLATSTLEGGESEGAAF